MKSENYDPGFSKQLAVNLDDLDDRIHKYHKAAMIIIDGGVGEGKTTEGVLAADYINNRHDLPPIDLKTCSQLAMGGEDFAKKLVQCHLEGLPVLIYDEAGDFNKRGSLSRFNALLNRTFETYRAFKVLVILILPSMSALDNEIFDKNIPRLLIRCHSRTLNQGNFKAYSLYRMLYIRDNMKKMVVKTDAYNKTEPNFQGHFKDLSPARSRQLDEVSTKGKIKELGEADIKFKGLVNYEEISKRVNKSQIWLKLVFKQLKIKPERQWRRRHYFDGSVVDRILDYIDDGGKVQAKK